MRAEVEPGAVPHLRVEGLTAGYGGVPVIDDVSLAVDRGRITALIGPNGAGKSTVLKAVVGVIRAMSGKVFLGGEDVTNLATERLVAKGIGYVPQMKDVFGPLSVHENLLMGAYLLRGSEVDDRLREVFAVFPALESMRTRQASKLSGGERKMLAFGRALMLRPTALVLDEPTANLSPELSEVLLRTHVRRLASSGVAILLVEQKARLALEVADLTHLLVSGRTQLSGESQTLLARPEFAELMLGRTLTKADPGERQE
ncbi:MAG TPA: ABC transporter ATP-binding protein [Candidatus Dormibacteraeota bacterium]|nr:ABC transporter ATP-binding protein [Candidatus Dormibacteraeota bacterium]